MQKKWTKMTKCQWSDKVSIYSFLKYWWSKIPQIWLDQRHTRPQPPKGDSLICHLPLMNICVQKSKISIDSSQRYYWSKNLAIELDERHNWPQPTKNGSLECYHPLIIISIPWRLTSSTKVKIFIGSLQW